MLRTGQDVRERSLGRVAPRPKALALTAAALTGPPAEVPGDGESRSGHVPATGAQAPSTPGSAPPTSRRANGRPPPTGTAPTSVPLWARAGSRALHPEGACPAGPELESGLRAADPSRAPRLSEVTRSSPGRGLPRWAARGNAGRAKVSGREVAQPAAPALPRSTRLEPRGPWKRATPPGASAGLGNS